MKYELRWYASTYSRSRHMNCCVRPPYILGRDIWSDRPPYILGRDIWSVRPPHILGRGIWSEVCDSTYSRSRHMKWAVRRPHIQGRDMKCGERTQHILGRDICIVYDVLDLQLSKVATFVVRWLIVLFPVVFPIQKIVCYPFLCVWVDARSASEMDSALTSLLAGEWLTTMSQPLNKGPLQSVSCWVKHTFQNECIINKTHFRSSVSPIRHIPDSLYHQ